MLVRARGALYSPKCFALAVLLSLVSLFVEHLMSFFRARPCCVLSSCGRLFGRWLMAIAFLVISGGAAPMCLSNYRPFLAQAEPLGSVKVGELTARLVKSGSAAYEFQLSGVAAANPSVLVVDNPLRFVVDVPGVASKASQSVAIRDGEISAIRVGAHPDKTRFVLDLKGTVAPEYKISPSGRGSAIMISFDGTAPVAAGSDAGESGSELQPVPESTPVPKHPPTPQPTKSAGRPTPQPTLSPTPPATTKPDGKPDRGSKAGQKGAPSEDIERRIDELLNAPAGAGQGSDAADNRGEVTDVPGSKEGAAEKIPGEKSPGENGSGKFSGRSAAAKGGANSAGANSAGAKSAGGRDDGLIPPPGQEFDDTEGAKRGTGERSGASAGNGSAAGKGAIDAIYYQMTSNTKVPALAINLSGFNESDLNYTLNRRAPDQFELTIDGAHFAGPHLGLAQFPPDSFKGFTVVQAAEEGGKVVVKIYVEENTKLFPFTSKGQLWLRVGQ